MKDKTEALNIILFFIIIYVLKAGQSIFLPFVVALFLWSLIYILSSRYFNFFTHKLRLSSWSRYLSRILAIITLTGIVYFIIVGIKNNIDKVYTTFGQYQTNMSELLDKLQSYIGIKNKITFSDIVQRINIPMMINDTVQGFASFLSNSVMVLVYLLFILLEEKSFSKKLPKLFPNKRKETDILKTLKKIYSKIEVYMSVKLFTSFLTGVLAYMVMSFVNLDFALFWAILMFLFNFIPTVGSIISSVFPILLSLLQFNGELFPFSVVAIGIISIQVFIGNIIDPKIMGTRLNLSPLVLILSLVIWGSIWGIVGMFLCVPIMIILTIVLSQIPSTKRIAIFLTADGDGL